MRKEGAFAVVIALLFIAGCGPGGGGISSTAPTPDAHSGSEGVVIRFLPNYPPQQIYDTQPFDVMVEVRNRGAADVNPAKGNVYLSGFDPAMIPGIPTTGAQLPTIEGKTEFNPEGGYETVEFKSALRALGVKEIDKYSAPLQATACYLYYTVASENVCIDPDPYSVTGERKVCTPTSVGFGTQGAPIAVTSVDVDAAPRTTRFKISIANVGGGVVFKPGGNTLSKCSPYSMNPLEYNEINHVMVTKVEVSGRQITSTCKPEGGFIRLDPAGRGELFCEFSGIPGSSAYATPLIVELDYGYKSSVIRNVDILRTP